MGTEYQKRSNVAGERNLFSEGVVMRLKYVVVKRNTTALIYKDCIKCKAKRKQFVYIYSLKLWHERLVYFNAKEVKILLKVLIACKDSGHEKFVCEGCFYGKQVGYHSIFLGGLCSVLDIWSTAICPYKFESKAHWSVPMSLRFKS